MKPYASPWFGEVGMNCGLNGCVQSAVDFASPKADQGARDTALDAFKVWAVLIHPNKGAWEASMPCLLAQNGLNRVELRHFFRIELKSDTW